MTNKLCCQNELGPNNLLHGSTLPESLRALVLGRSLSCLRNCHWIVRRLRIMEGFGPLTKGDLTTQA